MGAAPERSGRRSRRRPSRQNSRGNLLWLRRWRPVSLPAGTSRSRASTSKDSEGHADRARSARLPPPGETEKVPPAPCSLRIRDHVGDCGNTSTQLLPLDNPKQVLQDRWSNSQHARRLSQELCRHALVAPTTLRVWHWSTTRPREQAWNLAGTRVDEISPKLTHLQLRRRCGSDKRAAPGPARNIMGLAGPRVHEINGTRSSSASSKWTSSVRSMREPERTAWNLAGAQADEITRRLAPATEPPGHCHLPC